MKSIRHYKEYMMLTKNLNESEVVENPRYLGLGNYLFFTREDALRKYDDMLDNMSDMEAMERQKPGYIAVRIVKAQMLATLLQRFGLMDEYIHLEEVFSDAGYAFDSHLNSIEFGESIFDNLQT